MKGNREDWAVRGISGMFLEKTDLWVSRLAREDLKTAYAGLGRAEQRQTGSPSPGAGASSLCRPRASELWVLHDSDSRNCARHSLMLSLSHLELATLRASLRCQLADSFLWGFLSTIISWANSPDKSHFIYSFYYFSLSEQSLYLFSIKVWDHQNLKLEKKNILR